MKWSELKPSERKLIIVGGIVAAVFLLFFLARGSGGQSRQNDIVKLERNRDAFMADLARYRDLKRTVDEVDGKLELTPGGFDLFASLSQMLDELNLRPAIRKMTPNPGAGTDFFDEAYVDMELQQIALDDLVSLLRKIDEAPEFIRVSQLTVKRRQTEEGVLDVSIRVSAYSSKTAQAPAATP